MYDTTKPYNKEIIELIHKTWETPYISVINDCVIKKFNNLECKPHTDGIGTKGIYHYQASTFREAVIDALAMNLNDIAFRRSIPYAINDHIFLPEDNHRVIHNIIQAPSIECIERNIAILDGETSIHNNMQGLEISITMMGFNYRDKPNKCEIGDFLIGIESNGLHSNGFTKIRDLFQDEMKRDFVQPTYIYSDVVYKLDNEIGINGMMHITGGAFTKLKNILHESDIYINNRHKLNPQGIYYEIHDKGVSDEEMYKTFNCGIGFLFSIPESNVQSCLNSIKDYKSDIIGQVVKGNNKIKIKSKFSHKIITI